MEEIYKLEEDHGKHYSLEDVISDRANVNSFTKYYINNSLKEGDIIICHMITDNPKDKNKPYKKRPVIIVNPSIDIPVKDKSGKELLIQGAIVIPITSTYNSRVEDDRNYKIPFKKDEDLGLNYPYKSYMNLIDYHKKFLDDSYPLPYVEKVNMLKKIGELPLVDKDNIYKQYTNWELRKQKDIILSNPPDENTKVHNYLS